MVSFYNQMQIPSILSATKEAPKGRKLSNSRVKGLTVNVGGLNKSISGARSSDGYKKLIAQLKQQKYGKQNGMERCCSAMVLVIARAL